MVAEGIGGTVELELGERAGREFGEGFDFEERH